MRTLTPLLLLAVFTAPAVAQNGGPTRSYGPTFPPDYFKYGPSWLGSRGSPEAFGSTLGPKRPEKVEAAVTSVATSRTGNGMAVGVWLWADGPVEEKHTYELRYQLRLHTKRGDEGPVLGTADRPKGISYSLKRGVKDGTWNGLEGKVDITRKELSGMTNLPEVKGGTTGYFVRVEPQLYDATADKYLTPARPNALILHAVVGEGGKVVLLDTLADWAAVSAGVARDRLKASLDDLDAYRQAESGVGVVLGRTLDDPKVKAATKVEILAALPAANGNDVLGRDRDLWDVLETLAASDDADLKAAAKAKMEAVREYNRPSPKK